MQAKKCGCYDGPYSRETPTILVSVRCQDHLEIPTKNGFSLMHIGNNGVAKSVAPRDTHTQRDLALAKKRKTNADRSHKFAKRGNS